MLYMKRFHGEEGGGLTGQAIAKDGATDDGNGRQPALLPAAT